METNPLVVNVVLHTLWISSLVYKIIIAIITYRAKKSSEIGNAHLKQVQGMHDYNRMSLIYILTHLLRQNALAYQSDCCLTKSQ